MSVSPLTSPGNPWRIAGSPVSVDAGTRFRVADAPSNIRKWILNLYQGIQAYFPLPDETSWQELQAVAQWKTIDSRRRSYERIWEPRIESILSWHGPLVAQAYGRTRTVEGALNAISGEMIPALKGELENLQLDVERGFLEALASSVRIEKAADPFTIIDPLLIAALIRWNRDTLGQKITRIDEATRRRINNVIINGTRAGDSIYTIMDRIRMDQSFSRFRSYLIARTEVIASSNAATHFGIQANLESRRVTKDWLSTLDARTRATHVVAGMTQKKIPQKDPFRVGGFNVMFPGDSTLGAPGHEVIQCRCTALYNYDPPSRRTPRTPKPPPPPKPPNPVLAPKPTPAPAPTGAALVEQRVQEVMARVAALEDLSALRASLESEISSVLKQLGKATGDEWKLLHGRLVSLRAELGNMTGGSREAIHTILRESRPGPGTKVVLKNVHKDLKVKAAEAQEWLDSVLGDRWGDTFEIKYMKTAKNRAFATPWEGKVHLNTGNRTRVHVHEIGHVLERHLPELNEAEAFLLKRTPGESPVKMQDLFPGKGYKAEEITLKDKFDSPYMGKVYKTSNKIPKTASGTYATEIGSMGLEAMFADPMDFFRKDPDYFAYILRFIWGGKP